MTILLLLVNIGLTMAVYLVLTGRRKRLEHGKPESCARIGCWSYALEDSAYCNLHAPVGSCVVPRCPNDSDDGEALCFEHGERVDEFPRPMGVIRP